MTGRCFFHVIKATQRTSSLRGLGDCQFFLFFRSFFPISPLFSPFFALARVLYVCGNFNCVVCSTSSPAPPPPARPSSIATSAGFASRSYFATTFRVYRNRFVFFDRRDYTGLRSTSVLSSNINSNANSARPLHRSRTFTFRTNLQVDLLAEKDR